MGWRTMRITVVAVLIAVILVLGGAANYWVFTTRESQGCAWLWGKDAIWMCDEKKDQP